MLEIPVEPGLPRRIEDFDATLLERPISTARHCFGCTASAGSGCAGATVT
jgi:hypothetical protein